MFGLKIFWIDGIMLKRPPVRGGGMGAPSLSFFPMWITKLGKKFHPLTLWGVRGKIDEFRSNGAKIDEFRHIFYLLTIIEEKL